MTNDKKAVLVLEDDEPIRAMIVRALSAHYTVYDAGDAQSGLAILAEKPLPNAIVCDVMMPGLTGTDFARKMKASPRHQTIPIIFVTACAQPLDVIAGINAGARYYLTKPFKVCDLLGAVAKAVEGSACRTVSRGFANARTLPQLPAIAGGRNR